MLNFLTIYWLELFLLFLHLAVVSVLVPKIVLQRRESGATLAWILAIIFLPFIGLLAFWLLGTTRIRIMRRKRRYAEQHLVPSLARFHSTQQLSGSDALVAGTLYDLTSSLDECGPQPGCEVTMYRDNRIALDVLEEAIANARQHIHLIYYTWEADQTGRRFRDALTRAAQRGVEVRLLIDDVGSYATKSGFFAPLVAAGGEVERFLPLSLLSRQVSVNNRNHRKIVIIDGCSGFTGSMNIGDLYAGLSGPWEDLQVQVKGRVVYELQQIFCEDWYHATGKDLATEKYFPPVDFRGDVCASFLASGPSDDRWRKIHTVLFAAINTARDKVWIETPYFVPDAPIAMALQTTALRGVDVRLLLPARSDHRMVMYAGRSFYDELLHAGVRIFEISDSIPHAKTTVIDGIFATAGSANMDQRSFRLNFEANLLFFGKKVASQLENDFEQACQTAREVTLEKRRTLPRSQRLLEGFARILAPLL